MENKNVGWLIIGISAVIIIIIFLFNNAMKEIVKNTCGSEHAIICPMSATINTQTYLSLAIVAVLVIIGIVLMISKPKEKIIIKKIKTKPKEKKKKFDTSGLRKEDKEVFKLIQENRTIFQADLIEKTGFGKAKISRILDRLENQDFIERKRRGMTNVVVLKD